MKRFLMMMTLIGLVGNWNSTLTAQLVSPDSLYLNEDLPEINIVAVKPLIKAEADKTTYSIAEDPDSRTYTLLEMLRKVPLVTVDGEDNVKVNGQSSFKIGNYILLYTITKIIKGHITMYPFIIQSFFSFFFPFPSFLTLQERVFRKRGSRGSIFGL